MNEPTITEANVPQPLLASRFAAQVLNKLLCRLKMVADRGVPFDDRSLAGTIARNGTNIGLLLGWQPGPPEQQALSEAQVLCADTLNPSSWRNLPDKHAHLQHLATAAAINIGRLEGWLRDRPTAPTRRSRFAALRE